jgi:hypothetical protein
MSNWETLERMVQSASLVLVVGLGSGCSTQPVHAQPQPPPQPPRSTASTEPKVDRAAFAKSAASIARADLMACRHNDAKITRPGSIDPAEFAKSLNGVWLNQNRRTVHGLPVETDTAFYIDMRGTKGQAILIDRNNLGTGQMTAPFAAKGRFARATVRKPMAMTFISCSLQFFDQYVKVSDEVPYEALGMSTKIRLAPTIKTALATAPAMDVVWKQLVSSKYFDTLDMPTSAKSVAVKRVTPQLGDHTRVAVLVDGRTVDEAAIESGDAPGAEYELPMLTGALFKISVTPTTTTPTAAAGPQSVVMQWDAEYRGAGIGIPAGSSITGIERGTFKAEGGAYVSSIGATGPDTWLTSECGSKNGLEAAALIREGGTTALPGHDGHAHSGIAFDRVVIGSP